jgi:hypothetical protein
LKPIRYPEEFNLEEPLLSNTAFGITSPSTTAALFIAVSILVSCSDSSSESGNGNANSLTGSSDAKGTVISDLFRDALDFNPQDVREGSTNCTDIIDNPDVAGLFLKWPDQLKTYLSDILDKFPSQQLIKAAVHGIYLVPNSAMYDPTTKTSSAGLACDRGSDFKGLIFLNYNSVVQKRSRLGVGDWQASQSISNAYISVTEGDAAAVTLIHELFHAIDNKLFQHGSPENLGKRHAFQSQSWIGDAPKYARGMILSLNEAGTGNAPARRCKHSGKTVLQLLGAREDAQGLAQELQDLQEKTNFIVPYTMASPSEDFAETLTVYYFGAYYRSWQKRVVSFEKQPIFIHDTEFIIKTKQQHKSKICAAANLVFGSCKLWPEVLLYS